MENQENFDVWKRHIEEWNKSGLSQKDYCNKNNLKISTFGYWRRKLSETPIKKDEIFEVNKKMRLPFDLRREPVMELTVNGVTIKFGMDMTINRLVEIVKALKELT